MGIFGISTINASKLLQSAAKQGNMAIFELCNVFTLQDAFRSNSANYKKKYVIQLKSQYNSYFYPIYMNVWS